MTSHGNLSLWGLRGWYREQCRTKFVMYLKQNLSFQLTRNKQLTPGNQNSKTETITKLQSEFYRNVVDMQIRFHSKNQSFCIKTSEETIIDKADKSLHLQISHLRFNITICLCHETGSGFENCSIFNNTMEK